ncbi:Cathepsin L [Acropora cervicornis]|uniref:Cathepsin L n=1 Tax=Acropora cervicornis TaxID=6130 RepID=A0AAD9V5V5_ACRCE|nr:Cathepsin L [Acropora cervicornis]
MKGFLAFVLCLVASSGYVLNFGEYDAEWMAWKSFHNKKYETQREEDARYTIWGDNLKKIQQHNSEGHSYTLAMNHFGDLTVDEYRIFVLQHRSHFSQETRREGATFLPPSGATLPATVDWRTRGYVTPVKNQGVLGESWSFSVTGSVEGQHFKKTGKLVSLSEQNLVDCSGCREFHEHEGVIDCGFKYIKRNGGIDTESGYPSPCHTFCCFLKDKVGATVTGYVDVPHGNETALQYAVATVGPISIVVNSGLQSFQFYQSGVYDDPACTSMVQDHAMLVVGYGTLQGKDYWLVKNSWGTRWGMKGYIMMSRNKDNQCGIASNASYPLV